jgi:hypothetical protein
MSRKDYEAFAKAIREMICTSENERQLCAQVIANVCANDNPRFNKQKFKEACNLECDRLY